MELFKGTLSKQGNFEKQNTSHLFLSVRTLPLHLTQIVQFPLFLETVSTKQKFLKVSSCLNSNDCHTLLYFHLVFTKVESQTNFRGREESR